MPTLSVDNINQANAEFHNIGVEAEQLSEYLKGIETAAVRRHPTTLATHACLRLSSRKNLYGHGKIMSNLAKNLDGDPVGKNGESWHQALLLRLSNPYTGGRDRVISEGTLALLNNLRGFRHRERNSYAATLDLGIVIERARDAIAVVVHLKNEIQPFMTTSGLSADRHI